MLVFEKCLTCDFFCNDEEIRADSKIYNWQNDINGSIGQCRRNAPTKPSENRPWNDWPPTDRYAWCGDWAFDKRIFKNIAEVENWWNKYTEENSL
jgi:hypothetical protein